jgi:hypothetical protein
MNAVTLGRSALFTALVVSLTGCCSIIHGTRQDVGISSAPTGAIVKIDNVPSGNTPVVAKLTRKDNHFVRVELSGYQPFDMTLTRKVSGWVWGNIVFGGLIGLAVDAIDGAFYNLSPEQVSATLAANHASVSKTNDGIYLFAVLRPEPGWVKVGQLQATH